MEKKPFDHKVAILFLQTANQINANINALLEPLDLSLAQLKVLWIIYQQPSERSTVKQIKEQMTDPGSNVSRLLNKLMTKKWICKQRDENDQRIVHIFITSDGVNAMCLGKEIMDQKLTSFQSLTQSEQAELTSILAKL